MCQFSFYFFGAVLFHNRYSSSF